MAKTKGLGEDSKKAKSKKVIVKKTIAPKLDYPPDNLSQDNSKRVEVEIDEIETENIVIENIAIEDLVNEPIIVEDIIEDNQNASHGGSTVNEDIFTTVDKLYLQIHIANIYSIFGSAIILPMRYVRNRTFIDPQSQNKENLLLTNGIINGNNQDIALFEINLLDSEKALVTDCKYFGYYNIPIPISRIKCIYVLNENVKKEILHTAFINDGGIIPSDLIVPNFPNGIKKISLDNKPTITASTDLSKDVLRYNKILGTLAFLKNYPILLSNKLDTLATYPDHFFYAMQALNSEAPFQSTLNEKATLFYRQLFELQNGIESVSLKWLFERVKIERNINDDDVKEFANIFLSTSKAIEAQVEFKDILINLTKGLERKNAIQSIAQLQGSEKFSLYLFAFLRTYGNANSEDKSISRLDMVDILSTHYGEFVFSMLGFFYGYNILRNYDETFRIKDRVVVESLSILNKFPIKFEMTTLLDYVVIESVYSNVFVKKSDKINISFLESSSIKSEWVKENKSLSNNYTFKVDDVFGKKIYQISKKTTSNDTLQRLMLLPQDIPVISELGVYCFRHSLPRHFLNLGDLILKEGRIKYFIYYKRDDIIDALKKNKLKEQDLLQRIELSMAAKEL